MGAKVTGKIPVPYLCYDYPSGPFPTGSRSLKGRNSTITIRASPRLKAEALYLEVQVTDLVALVP